MSINVKRSFFGRLLSQIAGGPENLLMMTGDP
jgi:hypothetical protein